MRRWKTRMCMRLTERMREFIPKAGCCMLKRTVYNFERWGSRWSGYGHNRPGSSTAMRLNSDQFRKIRRLRGWENFIREREIDRERERSLYSIRSLTFNQWRLDFCLMFVYFGKMRVALKKPVLWWSWVVLSTVPVSLNFLSNQLILPVDVHPLSGNCQLLNCLA